MANDNQHERREQKRDIALYNLRSKDLSNLATAYIIQQKDSDFGEMDNSAVEKFLYHPSFSSAVSGDLKYIDSETEEETLLAGVSEEDIKRSREGGRRYSGRVEVSEYKTIGKAANIIQDGLTRVKVEDIMELMGSDVQVDQKYKDKYVGDLLESEDEKDKKVANMLIGVYLGYLAAKGVSRALSQTADSSKSGLERLLSGEELPRAA